MNRLKGKECVKAHFDITVKTAEGIPISSGNVYLTWKRGKKSGNSGETKRVVVKDKKAVFEELISLSCTLYKIPKKGYEAKNLSVTMKEEKGKKGNSLAKAVIDLAEFMGSKDDKRSFSLKPKKGKTPVTLVVSVKTKESELSPDDEMTETDNVDASMSDDDDDAEDFQDDDHPKHKEKGTPVKADSKRDSVSLSSPAVPPSDKTENKRDSVSISSPTTASSKELDDLRAELEKAKRRTRELATENVDQEEQINELKKQIEGLKKGSTTQTASALSPEKEAEMKKRMKELASENVDMEEQITDLKGQIEQLKNHQIPNGTRSSGKDDELNKRIHELQETVKSKDALIAAQRQEIDKLQEKESSKVNEKSELRSRIKELASENVELEGQFNDLKQEIESLKKTSLSVSKSSTEITDLSIKVRDLTDANRRKDNQIADLQEELDQLSRTSHQKDSEDSNDLQQQIQDLTKESKEKTAAINSSKQEIEKLKRDLQDAQSQKSKAGSTERDNSELRRKLDDAINEKNVVVKSSAEKEVELTQLRNKVENLKSKKEDANERLERSKARERELEERVQELEESNERLETQLTESATKSASSLTKDRDREREREREKREKERSERDRIEKERRQEQEELEKERELRMKTEKELRTLREKIRELEAAGTPSISVHSKKPSNTVSDESGAVIISAIYETPASYRNEDGIALCAAELWEALLNNDAFGSNSDFATKAVSSLEKSVLRMPYDINALFYWLSTTTALLHMLRDQPGVEVDNDRDPIIDGVYKVEGKKPSNNAPLQDQLEWVCYITYESLVKASCKVSSARSEVSV